MKIYNGAVMTRKRILYFLCEENPLVTPSPKASIAELWCRYFVGMNKLLAT